MPTGLKLKKRIRREKIFQTTPADRENFFNIELLEKSALKSPNQVIESLNQQDQQGRTTAHLLAANKESNNKLVRLLDVLANSQPQAVWAILLSQYQGVKLGVTCLQESSNAQAMLSLLTKLFKTVNILNDFDISEKEIALDKMQGISNWGAAWDEKINNTKASIVRSLFHIFLATTDPEVMQNVLGLLIKASETDRKKTQFLISHSENRLTSFNLGVMLSKDAVCYSRFAYLLDLTGEPNEKKRYTGFKHEKTAELITKYITSEPYEPEKLAMAKDALKPGTTLNEIFDSGYSSRERSKCCFTFFFSPKEYHRQLITFLQRYEEQPIASP